MAGSVAEGDVCIREEEAEPPELTGGEVNLGVGPLKEVRKVPNYFGLGTYYLTIKF
jgi:hypothetical protein